VDVFWGAGFIVVAAFSLMMSPDYGLRKIIVSMLVLIWGLRLTLYIYQRNKGKGEDFRYRQWRETWKNFTLRSFLQIFMLQGLFLYIISYPIWYINGSYNEPLSSLDTVGLVIFGIGFLFEVIGDMQLAYFKLNPENKGKLMVSGLWRFTRHPNYFGEALIWWGLWVYALSIPMGWITIISPITITILLRFISGVPMLEKKMSQHPDWPAYASRTAPFVPFIRFF